MTLPARLVLLGAGGHAKVLLALAGAAGLRIDAVCDPHLAGQGVTHWRGLAVLDGDAAVERLDCRALGLVNGIGQLAGGSRRAQVFRHFRELGFSFPALVHPAAWVAPGVVLEEGVQVMAGAIVQPDVHIGANSVINTGAGIDHDCRIEADVHVAPGAVLCGGVTVGAGAFIGSGATVIQGMAIGAGAIVGAGAVIVRAVAADALVLASLGARRQRALPEAPR